MRSGRSQYLIPAVALLLLAAGSSAAWAQRVVSRVSGHGNLHVDGDGNPIEELRTFSFAAVRHADGTVAGQAELYSRAIDARDHYAIDCLVIDGNQATMVGYVTQTNDDPIFLGVGIIFGVEDNDEGSRAEPDRITFVYFFPPEDHDLVCELAEAGAYFPIEVNGAPLFPIEGGDIQVKP